MNQLSKYKHTFMHMREEESVLVLLESVEIIYFDVLIGLCHPVLDKRKHLRVALLCHLGSSLRCFRSLHCYFSCGFLVKFG